ncbi:predicted protein [Scheffersomyces stipitis CBS 6054]|uniref:Uncharacterized protein n=1 Tax=Scheffersomyces stipitis (strain ATCC 58785 / CBS 6054 / NBRC 10063 / NRRL Y-11545) TaxID=322104 RepID=A3LSI5_PICST|nr:predicted protein [Scheffersomyces stipitis CBS 6054]ABN65573.1 predicted protein [Scheffersomyces stipitis CBS 6054]KAG2733401.1 hypothetical protein G9P44_002926 [Scheffersomyces stipitis]
MIHRSREVNVDGVDCVVVASYSQSDSSRTPVTVYVNELNNAAMGDYVYAIGQSQTFLHHGTSSESGSGSGSIESLNLLLNKKLQRPVYLNVSGAAQVSTVSMFRAIVEVIDN